MSKKFWLKQIEIQKSPGFPLGSFPPVKGLGPSLNVVWGPNGVGKSTLARAMRSLFWNGRAKGEVVAEGTLDGQDSSWDLSVSQGRLKQVRLSDNQDLTLPGRNDELSESYWFPLHELLQEDGRHTATFLQQVRTRMQGGVDLDASWKQAGGILSFSRSTAAEAKQAARASEQLSTVIRNQSEHQHIQDKIERLQQEVDRGKEISLRKALLEDAQFLLEKQESILAKEGSLSLYSPAIERIDKSSSKRLKDLLLSQKKAEDELSALVQNELKLEQEFARCAIEESLLKDLDKPERVSELFTAYKDALGEQSTAEQKSAEARGNLEEWEAEHSWLTSGPIEEKTLQAYIQKLRSLAEECEPLRCKVDAAKRLFDELGSPEELSTPIQDLAKAQVRLLDWIEAFWKVQGTAKHKELGPRTKILLLAIIAGLGLLSSVLGSSIHPLFFVSGVALMLTSAFVLIPSSQEGSGYKQAEESLGKAKEEAERVLAQLGKPAPSPWTAASLQALALELGSEIVSAQEREKLNQRRNLVAQHLEASQKKLQEWVTSWQDAASALSLHEAEARLEGSQFFHFAQRLDQWSLLRRAFVQTQEDLKRAKAKTSHALSLLQKELGTDQSELVLLKVTSEGLVKRLGDARSLKKSLDELAERLVGARKHLDESQLALHDFWQATGLHVGDETGLEELVGQYDAWASLKLGLQYERTSYEEKAQRSPQALELAALYTKAELATELERVAQDLGDLEEKLVSLGRLKSTLEALTTGSELSDALFAQEEALAALEAFREEQVMAMMIAKLANDLKEESEKRFQPQVLTHASEWLSKITNYRYALFANNQGFFANDSILAKNFTLDELSSGTRIQLLFSIRMAFITMQEQSSDVRLPIFLDELLANSDDERALAIAEAIGKIAEERQVFYFTAQRDEVEKLKTIATSAVTVIALEDEKRGYQVSSLPLLPTRFAHQQIPLPLKGYLEYGRALGVAGPSLWEPVESQHTWHLLLSSEQLYGYLQKGLRYMGQIAMAVKDPSLLLRLDLLKRSQALAQEGRCKVLHIQDLDDPSLALKRNSAYWSQIEDVVGSEGITGNELLQAVEEKKIQRFSESNQEFLSNWLIEHGFATENTPMGSEAILDELFVEFEDLTVGSEDHEVVQRWLENAIEQ